MHIDLFAIADELYKYLTDHGIRFNRFGYPVIPTDNLLNDIPDEIVPYEHKNAAVDKKRTVLCHFANDEHLYRRVKKYKDDIDILREYMGATGFDLSPRVTWDIRKQRFNILISRMIDTYRVMNGVKLLQNFRSGSIDTLDSMTAPPGMMYAVGTLGCARGYFKYNEYLLKAKLLLLRPSKLLVYGRINQRYIDILDDFNQTYIVYPDFKSLSFKKNTKGGLCDGR